MADPGTHDEPTTSETNLDEAVNEGLDTAEVVLDKGTASEDFVDDALQSPMHRRWSDSFPEQLRSAKAEREEESLDMDASLKDSLDTLLKRIDSLDNKILSCESRVRKDPERILEAIKMYPEAVLHAYSEFPISDPTLRFLYSVITVTHLHEDTQIKAEVSTEMEDRQRLWSIALETMRGRQLEILCRYGDYLAEKLEILRQRIKKDSTDELTTSKHYWTEVAATLKNEEGQAIKACHDRISEAIKSLDWDQKSTFFMIHEYARRNTLMHAELFDLVNQKQWDAIGQRCKQDIEKLRELQFGSNTIPNAAIKNWVKIIEEFRDRWVSRSKGSPSWEARPIILEAIAAGVHNQTQLSKLAMFPKNATAKQREKEIKTMENEVKKAEKQHEQELREAELKKENKALKAQVEVFQNLLGDEGVPTDLVEQCEAQVKTITGLSNKIRAREEKIARLEDEAEYDKLRERTLKRLLREAKVDEKTIQTATDKAEATRQRGYHYDNRDGSMRDSPVNRRKRRACEKKESRIEGETTHKTGGLGSTGVFLSTS